MGFLELWHEEVGGVDFYPPMAFVGCNINAASAGIRSIIKLLDR